jgi:hypothetical protein
MTEQRPDGLTPGQSEAVRRLLAGARHDEGVPDDVAARLDATLADLFAERGAEAPADSGHRDADVVPLRRRWPKVLAAAAAVTLFGFGIVQYVDNTSSQDGAASGGADKDVASSEKQELGDNLSVSPGDQPATVPGAQDNRADGWNSASTQLDERTLTRLDVKGLRKLRPGSLDKDLLNGLTRDGVLTESSSGAGYDAQSIAVRCGPYYTVDGGAIFAASYRRHLALVLFHPALDGVRLVEIYDCESDTPRQTVRTVTLQTGE